MGHAARAKQHAWANGQSVGRGNPARVVPTARVISAEQHAAATRRGETAMRAQFSDRTYAVDQHGTIRRLRPRPPQQPIVTITQSVRPPVEGEVQCERASESVSESR